MSNQLSKALAVFNVVLTVVNAFYFYELRRNDVEHLAIYQRMESHGDRTRTVEQSVAGMIATQSIFAERLSTIRELEKEIAGVLPWKDQLHDLSERLRECEKKSGMR